MEPERRIEKLLRAFVKKRREQAGDPVELRPAARQQLHKEISRRAPGTSGGSFFSNLLLGFRPRLAFATCFIAVVAIGGWLLFPVLTGRKPATLASANSPLPDALPEEKSKETPAPPPEVAAAPSPVRDDKNTFDDTRKPVSKSLALQPDQPKGTEANRPSIASLNGTLKQAPVLENEIAPGSPAAGAAVASTPPAREEMRAFKTDGAIVDSFANTRALNKDVTVAPPMVSDNTATTLALAGRAQDAQKKVETDRAMAPPITSSVTFYGLAKAEALAAPPPASQHFYRLDALTTRQRAAGALSSPTPVLTSFRMEQSGDRMRVVDADGSVYTGAMQAAQDEIAPPASPLSAPKNKPLTAPAAKVPAQSQAVQNYFFRVAGTNRNLNQNIVFSGNLIPLTNTGKFGGGGGAGGKRQTAPDSSASSLLLNSRISGKAVIGNQKEIEVNATPAPQ